MRAEPSLSGIIIDTIGISCDLPATAIHPSTRIVDLGIDSVKMVWIVSRVEEAFGTLFSVDDILEFHLADRVSDLVDRIDRVLQAAKCDAEKPATLDPRGFA